MREFQQLNQSLEKESNDQSVGPGYYQVKDFDTGGGPVYPWAPTARIQRIGGSLLKDQNITDVESELSNITRPLSKDQKHHYNPYEGKKTEQQHLKDGFFHQESTLLSNPPSLLRGQTKNRWEDLFKNPLENSIEPFERLGQNTYLSLIDNDEDCKDEVKEEVKE